MLKGFYLGMLLQFLFDCMAYSLYKVLLLDEWLLDDLSDAELHFLFELIERRYDETATIFCTQYKVEDCVRKAWRRDFSRFHYGSNYTQCS